MTDIFISYARGSAGEAQTVAELLRGLAYGVWRDDQLPAHRPYAEVIEERLHQAKAVVVIWSAEAVKSQWVRAEADVARLKGTLVQMSLDGTVPPLPFNMVQCADLTGWLGESTAPGWRKVLASVRTLVRGAAGVDPAAAKAEDEDRLSVERDAVRAASQHRPFERPAAEPARDKPARPARAEKSAKPAAPILAVLAFDNLSGDTEMAYFSDGVSEEIQETVARGAALKVIGRSSSFQFRGADKDVRHVAAELGATHVLDGSVRRSGPKVRISAQLIECDSRTTLWSERFDRDLADIFALQDEIAGAVATALKTTFSAPAAPIGKIDPAAYEAYLKGRSGQNWASQTEDPAIGHLEEAVSLAPAMAPAWAALAQARVVQARLAPLVGSEPKATREQISEAANTALGLDPASGLAYAALSHLEPWGAYRARESLMRKAVEAAPGDPRTLTEMTLMLSIVGRVSDARDYLLKALSLDPFYQEAVAYDAVQLAFLGRYDEAQVAFAEARMRWPALDAFVASPIHFAAYQSDWDRYDALIAQARERGLDRSPSVKEAIGVGRWLRDPKPGSHKMLLERIEADLARTGALSFPALTMAGRMGLVDEAYALIERASFAYLFDPAGPLPAGWFSPGIIFDPTTNKALIDDPRFVGFCHKLGLVDYWLASRTWPDVADRVSYDFRRLARQEVGEA
jgi:adenylate cyclase